MSDNKRQFEVEIDGTKVSFDVKRPDYKANQKGNLVYGKSFREAVDAGLLVRARIDKVMREQNLWDEEKQKEYEEARKRLLENEKKLARGGIKKSAAKEIAIDMRRDRALLQLLSRDRNRLDSNTAESHADNARFNYYISVCTVYSDSGKPYYKDHEDYLSRDVDPVGPLAGNALGNLLFGLEDDFELKLPENKFLLQYEFCNKALHLIDKQGRPVNTDGKLVDDKGRTINEKGDLIDSEGTPYSEDGEYKLDFAEFLDDEA